MIDSKFKDLTISTDAILVELLGRFPKYLQNRWIKSAGDKGYFGDGSNEENGIRTNSNALYAAAVLGSMARACLQLSRIIAEAS
jgi:hypothetical protein